MTFDKHALDDYIDVATRITEFRARYPIGSLRGNYEVIYANNSVIAVAYRAEAYRTPEDMAPGIGCAWEVVPGKTPYTRGSELQNAETSAWGRAIIAVGAADAKAGIASREEVQLRQAEDDWPRNRDGSLSRSRMTDDELRQAGTMTSPELRAHNALRRDGEPAAGRVERHAGPPPMEEDWQQPEPEDVPGSAAGTPVITRVMLEFRRLGITNRDARLALSRRITGAAELASSNDLSLRQANHLLNELQVMKAEEPAPDVDAEV